MLNAIFYVFVRNEIVIVENFFETGKIQKESTLKIFPGRFIMKEIKT